MLQRSSFGALTIGSARGLHDFLIPAVIMHLLQRSIEQDFFCTPLKTVILQRFGRLPNVPLLLCHSLRACFKLCRHCNDVGLSL